MFIPTKDGSNTLLHPTLNVHYHSLHGALQESLHVFIHSGLDYINQQNTSLNPIRIFEMGFGTGLNAFLSLRYAIENQILIHYNSIERDPLNDFQSNSFIQSIEASDLYLHLFNQIHLIEWNQPIPIHPLFVLQKINNDLTNYKMATNYDLIYFDAFAPNAQPELWTVAVLSNLYHSLNTNGILVTYCAQGQFKRNLKEVGFIIESIPGPPGKREMTRAIKG